jgi:hypothetical protein
LRGCSTATDLTADPHRRRPPGRRADQPAHDWDNASNTSCGSPGVVARDTTRTSYGGSRPRTMRMSAGRTIHIAAVACN